MSLKLRMFAGKWRDVITLSVLVVTCVTFVWGMGRWTERQDLINTAQDKSIALVQIGEERRLNREERRDSVLNVIVLEVKSLIAWRNEFEPEHIELMKEHNKYPKKMYRGEVVPTPFIR